MVFRKRVHKEMEYIDHIYYINLDYRLDRKKEFENEMTSFTIDPEKYERISGIHIPQQEALGCSLSHKKTIEVFIESSYKNCIIFEDDFQWLVDREYVDFLLRSIFEENIPFDCIVLTGNIFKSEETDYPFLRKVLDVQTTAGYILTKEFAPILLQNFTESSEKLLQYYTETGEKNHKYCLDIYWKKLQPTYNWFMINPKVGIQRESYSDIEGKITKYGM